MILSNKIYNLIFLFYRTTVFFIFVQLGNWRLFLFLFSPSLIYFFVTSFITFRRLLELLEMQSNFHLRYLWFSKWSFGVVLFSSGLRFKGKVYQLIANQNGLLESYCFLLWYLTKSYGLFRYTTDGGTRETLEKGTIRGDTVFSGSVCDQLHILISAFWTKRLNGNLRTYWKGAVDIIFTFSFCNYYVYLLTF